MGNDGTSSPLSAAVAENLRDYTFMWWASGWRAEKVRCVQTGYYGLAMDVTRVAVTHFGTIPDPLPYARAVSQPNDVIFNLPPAALELTAQTDAGKYACVAGGHPRLIESGRYLQRADIEGLVFADSAGTALPAECRLEIVAWPDRLTLLLEIVPREDLKTCQASIRFSTDTLAIEEEEGVENWTAGKAQTVHAVLFQRTPEAEQSDIVVQAFEQSSGKNLSVDYDAVRGWGTDQLWDQAAIGSWGESICYDPDVCLQRSMIDDVRPLMVTQMGRWTAKRQEGTPSLSTFHWIPGMVRTASSGFCFGKK